MPHTNSLVGFPVDSPVVLVTGAAKRLGREIALALSAGGWRVAVHYRGSELDAIKTAADCALNTAATAIFDCDLGIETDVRALLPRVVRWAHAAPTIVTSGLSRPPTDDSAGSSASADRGRAVGYPSTAQ